MKNITGRVLAALLGLVISAHVHLTVYVAGIPVTMPALALILAVVASVAAVCAWVAYAVPRQGWPSLIWKAGYP